MKPDIPNDDELASLFSILRDYPPVSPKAKKWCNDILSMEVNARWGVDWGREDATDQGNNPSISNDPDRKDDRPHKIDEEPK